MSQKTELKKKIKSNLTKGGKLRRTLPQIREERDKLKATLEMRIQEMRALVSGKVPRLAANGSHQQAVAFKALMDDCNYWPNNNGYAAALKQKIKKVETFINGFKEFL